MRLKRKSKGLAEIGRRIQTLHGTLCLRRSFEQAREIGLLLLQGKAMLPHGGYEPWYKSLGISKSSAEEYTICAKANVRRSGHLGVKDVVRAYRAARKTIAQERYGPQPEALAAINAGEGIITADCMEWLRARASESVPFFVFDPPYGVGMTFDGWQETNNAEDYWRWFKPFWLEIQRVLVPGGSAVFWQANRYHWDSPLWFPGMVPIACCYRIRNVNIWTPIVRWNKPDATAMIPTMAWSDWMQGTRSNNHKKVPGNHPCVKPLEDCRELIRRYTLPGMLVVDPFCGTGSIPLACKIEGRPWIGIERSAMYAAVARGRLKG